MKRKQNDSDFLRFLQNMPVPKVKNPAFKKSLEAMIVNKQQGHSEIRKIFGMRPLRFYIPLAAALLAAVVSFFLVIPILAPPERIQLAVLNGPVFIIDKESGKKTEAADGMSVANGTNIRTGAGGRAEMLFGGSTSVVIGRQSSIELLSVERNPEHEYYMVRLQNGTVECRINLKNRESSFNIATEYSLITVHGTHFLVTLTPEHIEVELKEGSITMNNFYSLRRKLDELKLKSAALYTRVSDMLNLYIRHINEKTVIKKDITEIKELNREIQDNINRIIHTESNEEIDKSIDEIRDAIDSSSIFGIRAEDTSIKEESAYVQPQDSMNTAGLNPKNDIPGAAPDVEEKKQEPVVEINLNGSVEQGAFAPDLWRTSEQRPAFKWTDAVSRSGRRSLQITSVQGEDKAIGWVYTMDHDLPYDKRVYLKVYIKTEGVSGQGVSLVLRADDTVQPTADAKIYTTSQGRRTITDTSDWKEYTLALPEPLYDGIKSITVYLIMLPGTKGDVYFDDISLYYKE
jgi:hypothetical protein